MAIAGETEDLALVRRMAEVSAETVEWLVDTVGARIVLITAYKHIGHSIQRLHAPVSRRGQDLVDDLLAAIDRRQIPLAVGNAIERLIVEDGAVVGARANAGDGAFDIRARKTILAVNGFRGRSRAGEAVLAGDRWRAVFRRAGVAWRGRALGSRDRGGAREHGRVSGYAARGLPTWQPAVLDHHRERRDAGRCGCQALSATRASANSALPASCSNRASSPSRCSTRKSSTWPRRRRSSWNSSGSAACARRRPSANGGAAGPRSNGTGGSGRAVQRGCRGRRSRQVRPPELRARASRRSVPRLQGRARPVPHPGRPACRWRRPRARQGRPADPGSVRRRRGRGGHLGKSGALGYASGNGLLTAIALGRLGGLAAAREIAGAAA